MTDREPGTGSRGLRGRRIGDRRVRVARPHTTYFRYVAPGILSAKPAATAPTRPIDRLIAGTRHALFGRALASEQEIEERLPIWKALATFSSDNLSSVAYATEAIMFTLLAAGTGAFWLVMPISGLIITIFIIIVISYRQTIRAYPSGGGSYIVAKDNLGTPPALLAAAALLTDYVLTVSVSVAAGIAAILSAFPGQLDSLRVPLCVGAIVFVTLINLRGVRESGTVFALPTYLFLATTLALIAIGIGRTLLGDTPHVTGVTTFTTPVEGLGVLLLMRAFADGCSAITGVEAVSNGVPAFKPPEWRNARTTLTIMGVLVAVMFLGLSYLAGVVGAQPSHTETIISQIGRSVYGTGPIYYVFQLATTGILVLAANTSYADFPRLSSILARDGFMPHRFAFRGERLSFNAGIIVLAISAIAVVVAFGGFVDALIPLYAIGVFTSITLSQAGMVRHWLRIREPGWRRSALINGVGAVSTGIVSIIFAVAKFALGAWLIIVIIPILVALMLFVQRQYERRRLETLVRPEAIIGAPSRRQHVVVPVPEVTREVVQAIKFGRTMSNDVAAVHITDDLERGEALRARFERQIPDVPFVVIESPYRQLVTPLIRYLDFVAGQAEEDIVVVLLPEYVPRHFWERYLYNDNGERIRDGLLGRANILIAEVPYRREK
ncbi:MAG TPA: APC family permease [Candidatus Dormibacteraeota bacterium]|nr:APC family permease [Candidatus Dormibacteraeota bacterium]